MRKSFVTFEVHTQEFNEDNGRRFRTGTIRARSADEAKDLAGALTTFFEVRQGIRPTNAEAFAAFYDNTGKFLRVPLDVIESMARDMGFITYREKREERRAKLKTMAGSADNPGDKSISSSEMQDDREREYKERYGSSQII